MKKLWILLAWAAIAAACSSEMEVPSPVNPDDDMVEVSFNLGGDYVSVEETPMTRADEGKTYYFIQVYLRDYYVVTGNKIYYSNLYAYGTFLSLENARIMIPSGYNLTYEAEVIKEGEDKLPDNIHSVGITEKFIYDDLFKLGGGNSLQNGHPYNTPFKIGDYAELCKVDRYYGKVQKVITDPEAITIPLDKYSFSLTFDVATPIDGSVVVGFSDPDDSNYIYKKKHTDGEGAKTAIFNAPLDAASGQTSVDVPLIIKWLRPGQEQVQEKYIIEEVINVKRNTNYNIKIDLNGRAGESSFGFTMNENEWAQESIKIE